MIKIDRTDSTLDVVSPYCPQFVRRAKEIGGKWNGRAWSFDARDEQVVRQALHAIYGGDDTTPRVSVRVTLGEDCYQPTGPVVLAGRSIASARGRDSGARVGDGVVVEAGGFISSGSVKNWSTRARPGTVIVMHDVPRPAVDLIAEHEDVEEVEVVSGDEPDYDALRAERERLVARLAEIDAELEDRAYAAERDIAAREGCY